MSVIKAIRLRAGKNSSNNSCCIQFLFVCYFYFSVSSQLCPKPSQKFSLVWIMLEMFCSFKSVFQAVKKQSIPKCFSFKFFDQNFQFALYLQFNPLFVEKWEDFHCKIKFPSQLLPVEKKIIILLNGMSQHSGSINFLSHF